MKTGGKVVFSVLAILIIVLTFSYIGNFFWQTVSDDSEKLPGQTDFTIEIDSRNDLSNLSKLVRDRARDDACKNSSIKLYEKYQKYPALESSYLSETPKCPNNKEDRLSLAEYKEFNPANGHDIEGIYSREKFEVKEPIEISVNGSSWLENNLEGIFSERYDKISPNCINSTNVEGYGLFLPENTSSNRNFDFQINSNLTYCRLKSDFQYSAIDKVTLCSGDKGFIQVNKGSPMNEDEAPSDAESYPYIQINEMSTQSCQN